MRRIFDVYIGILIWYHFSLGKSRNLFLVLLDDDRELNYYALSHAKKYAELNGFSDVEIICGDSNGQSVEALNDSGFQVHVVKVKKMHFLLSYLFLKADAIGVSVIPNCRIITFQFYNQELARQCKLGMFDKEYLVWYKMMYYMSNIQKPLQRTIPFEEG